MSTAEREILNFRSAHILGSAWPHQLYVVCNSLKDEDISSFWRLFLIDMFIVCSYFDFITTSFVVNRASTHAASPERQPSSPHRRPSAGHRAAGARGSRHDAGASFFRSAGD